jgi:catechol 2,3-dioxygenase-like lactoylglutathione lyase family enzyme
MKVRPIHFVPDVAAAVRFYEALGLRSDVRSRSGHWIELAASGGELCLHDAAIAADGAGRTGLALNLVADEPLEAVEARLRTAGFPPEGTIVDQEWGRSLLVPAPDGTIVQIDEPDRELYT